MNKKKSPRNKTIDFKVSDGREYLARCLRLEDLAASPANAQSAAGLTDAPANAAAPVDKTICGDTFGALAVLPDEFVDLLVVDPPYNLTKEFAGGRFAKQPAAAYAEYTSRWLEAVKHTLKPTASIYVCCDWESGIEIGRVLQGFAIVRNRITWQREKGRGAARNWKSGAEDIWFATMSEEYTFNVDAVLQRRRVLAPYRENGDPKDWLETPAGNFRDTHPSNFWDDISVPYWSMPENTAHPTQKPEKLIAKLILASTDEGDVVLDPFLGSGTTSVVAKKLNRRYLGIELSEQYCAWAEYRLELAETDSRIQGFEDGVFWERNTAAQQKSARRGRSTDLSK